MQLSHKPLPIRETANYLLNPALCLDWVKYWLWKFKGNPCHQTWTWASDFLGAVEIKWLGDRILDVGIGEKEGDKTRAGWLRSKCPSLEPLSLGTWLQLVAWRGVSLQNKWIKLRFAECLVCFAEILGVGGWFGWEIRWAREAGFAWLRGSWKGKAQ